MEFKVLGTSSGTKTKERNLSGSVLKFSNTKAFLFDCGDGILDRLKDNKIKVSTINKIFITHAHHDHFNGIFNLLSHMAFSANPGKLEIYVPEILTVLIKNYMYVSAKSETWFDFVNIIDVDLTTSSDIFELMPLDHNGAQCYGYILKFPVKNKLNVKLLKSDGILPSDFRFYYTNSKYSIPQKSKVLMYCGDNSDVSLIKKYTEFLEYKDCNITVYHEGTYNTEIYEGLKEYGNTHGHTSIYEITNAVKNLKNVKLLLSHFSPMLSKEMIMEDIALGANNVIVMEDNYTVEI